MDFYNGSLSTSFKFPLENLVSLLLNLLITIQTLLQGAAFVQCFQGQWLWTLLLFNIFAWDDKNNIFNKTEGTSKIGGHDDGILENSVVQKDHWRLGQGQVREWLLELLGFSFLAIRQRQFRFPVGLYLKIRATSAGLVLSKLNLNDLCATVNVNISEQAMRHDQLWISLFKVNFSPLKQHSIIKLALKGL